MWNWCFGLYKEWSSICCSRKNLDSKIGLRNLREVLRLNTSEELSEDTYDSSPEASLTASFPPSYRARRMSQDYLLVSAAVLQVPCSQFFSLWWRTSLYSSSRVEPCWYHVGLRLADEWGDFHSMSGRRESVWKGSSSSSDLTQRWRSRESLYLYLQASE